MSKKRLLTKDEIVRQSALRACTQVENYHFRKPVSFIESSEMIWCKDKKLEVFGKETSKWHDRNSMMAAPYGAEIYLQSDSDPSFIVGCPRYYFDELSGPKKVDAKKADAKSTAKPAAAKSTAPASK